MASMYESAQVGKRQEILDKIFNVEAQDTPFLSMLTTGPQPNQMLSTWVGEVYPDVASTGVLDGTAATSPAKVDRYLISGTAQHFRREWGVSTLANLTNVAGVGRNEAGHQMMLAMLLMKRMINQQFLSNDDCAAESGATPWTCRGAFKWLDDAAQTNYPVPSQLRPSGCEYTGALASLDESGFRNLLEAAFTARKGQVDLTGFVGVDLKAIIDDWTNVYPVASSTSQPRSVYNIKDNKTYQSMVDFLRFSVGNVKLVMENYLYRTTATGAAGTHSGKMGLFLDMSMWQVCYLQKPANTNLAPDGSGKKGFVDAVAILKCLNPLGQIKVECAS
jgi:hypothetical protein